MNGLSTAIMADAWCTEDRFCQQLMRPIPAGLKSWLFAQGSLTQHLRQTCEHSPDRQTSLSLALNQQRMLGQLSAHRCWSHWQLEGQMPAVLADVDHWFVLERDVTLRCAHQPMIDAHSWILARHAMDLTVVQDLQHSPLGDWIYQSHTQRLLVRWYRHQPQQAPSHQWQRLSCQQVDGLILLIQEAFHPNLSDKMLSLDMS